MVQNIAALHLRLEEAQVRVVCKDVGGSFGIKVHIYADEMATYALSKLLRRPIKFVADRVESFNTDIHARDHRCKGRIGVKRDGTHHGVRDRRSHRHRSLFDVSAHQRHRSQPGRQSRWRPLCDEELSCPRPRRVPEQERDVPVPRRRPSHRMLGDGRAGRSGGRENRDGSGGNPPPQSDCRRCLSLRVAFGPAVRAVVASRRDEQADGDDGLRRLARRAGGVAQARTFIAASALRVSSRSPIPARPFTASAAPGSRRRTASRCGWMRRVR